MLATVISEKAHEISRISAERDQLNRKVALVEQSKAILQEKINSLEKEKSKLGEENNTKNQAIEILGKEKNALIQEASKKQREAQMECDKLEEELLKSWKVLNNTKADLVFVKSEKTNSEKTKENLQQEILVLQEKVSEFSKQCERYRDERNKLIIVVQTNQEIRKISEEQKSEISAKNAEISTILTENANLRISLEKKNKEIEKLTTNLVQLQSKQNEISQKTVEYYNSIIHKKSNEISHLKNVSVNQRCKKVPPILFFSFFIGLVLILLFFVL